MLCYKVDWEGKTAGIACVQRVHRNPCPPLPLANVGTGLRLLIYMLVTSIMIMGKKQGRPWKEETDQESYISYISQFLSYLAVERIHSKV